MIAGLLIFSFAFAQPAHHYKHLSPEVSASLYEQATKHCKDIESFALANKDKRLQGAHRRHCAEPDAPQLNGMLIALYHMGLDLGPKEKAKKAFYSSKLNTIATVVALNPDFPTPASAAQVYPAVEELSGLAWDSKRNWIWSHGDSGTKEYIGRMSLPDRNVERIRVQGARNIDWESISVDDDGKVWIIDAGNNLKNRKTVDLYRINPAEIREGVVQVDRIISLTYPGVPIDSEATVISGSKLYLFAKEYFKTSQVFTADLSSSAPNKQKAVEFGVIPVTGPITDAYLSSRGELFLLTYFNVVEVLNWKAPAKRTIREVKKTYWGQVEALSGEPSQGLWVGREDGKIFSTKNP